MEDRERLDRLQTAAALLTVLKFHGGSARSAADWLGVSPTTTTNWLRMVETTTRKQGVPSDEHLRKLAIFVVWQIRQALRGTRVFLGRDFMRSREANILTRALADDYRHLADEVESQVQLTDAMHSDLRALIEKHGPEMVAFLGQTPEVRWASQDSLPEFYPAPPPVDPAALLRELAVTSDYIKAAEAELEAFFAERNRKFIGELNAAGDTKKRGSKKRQ
jgi:hypothetical protein